MSEFGVGDTVLVQLEATVVEDYSDGQTVVDAGGQQIGVGDREVIAVVKEADQS